MAAVGTPGSWLIVTLLVANVLLQPVVLFKAVAVKACMIGDVPPLVMDVVVVDPVNDVPGVHDHVNPEDTSVEIWLPKVNLGRDVPVEFAVVDASIVAGDSLSSCLYAEQVNPVASTFMLLLEDVIALGTLLHENDNTILDVPSHTKLLAEPEPVPNVSVLTEPEVGV